MVDAQISSVPVLAISRAPRAGTRLAATVQNACSPPGTSEWDPYQLKSFADPQRKVTAEGNVVASVSRSIEAELFANRSTIKIATSQVAMHLLPHERRILFSEVDRLLDIAHWEEESARIDIEAFKSFLRFLIFARPEHMPNMGVDQAGSVLASWHRGPVSVFAEFAPKDRCVVLIRSRSIRGPESFAWDGHVARLREVIAGNGAAAAIDQSPDDAR